MIELPKRDDDIYKEIEAFKDYELTNCIAYEMAVRNKEFQDYIINTINEVYTLQTKKRYYEDQLFHHETNSKILNDKELMEAIEEKTNAESKIEWHFESININIYNEDDYNFLLSLNFLSENQLDFIEEMQEELHIELNGGRGYCNPIDVHEDEYTLEEVLDSEDSGEVIKANSSYIEYNGFSIKTETILPPFKNVPLADDYDEEAFNTLVENPECLVYMGLYKSKKYIKSNFSREILPMEKHREVNLNLNLSLPKDELIAYISQIKDEYDNDNSIIKTPLELLGEDLEKSDNKHTQKKPKAEKYADWFYIYDCYQILKQNDKSKSNDTIYNEIDLLLLEHYNSTKEDYYSLETYKKTIMKNMKYLIDELGYKELITGVKNN